MPARPLVEGLTVNQAVALSIDRGGEWVQAACKVADITPRQIAFTPPVAPGLPTPLQAGTPVRADYQDEVACYQFDSVVIGYGREGIELLLVQRPERVQRIQRRDHVRLKILLPAQFRAVREAPDGWRPAPGPAVETVTHDLSAGGCRLQVREPVEPGTILQVALTLGDGQRLQLLARVVRNEEHPLAAGPEGNGDKVRYIGVEWIGLPQRERDQIVAFIFQEQVRRRRLQRP